LYGPRCDCVDWRLQLHEALLRSDGKSIKLPEAESRDWSSLRDSPSEAVRNWDRLLRGARIKPQLQGGELAFAPASDEDVYSGSSGEVTKPEGINYRTLEPETGGLSCEKIFGPMRSWHCRCGRYRGSRHKGITCEQCGVEVASARVRRERLGHIELPLPVVHPWHLNGAGRAALARRLNISPVDLERIADCSLFIFDDPGLPVTAQEVQLFTFFESFDRRPSDAARAATGGEAIEILLKRSGASKALVDAVIMRRLPVIPPELRPTVPMGAGSFAISDINLLYRSVLNRVGRLRRLIRLNAADATIRDERAELQKAIGNLLDNERSKYPSTASVPSQ
jgi:DNA-directed RNA polymerase subunit beta'